MLAQNCKVLQACSVRQVRNLDRRLACNTNALAVVTIKMSCQDAPGCMLPHLECARLEEFSQQFGIFLVCFFCWNLDRVLLQLFWCRLFVRLCVVKLNTVCFRLDEPCAIRLPLLVQWLDVIPAVYSALHVAS